MGIDTLKDLVLLPLQSALVLANGRHDFVIWACVLRPGSLFARLDVSMSMLCVSLQTRGHILSHFQCVVLETCSGRLWRHLLSEAANKQSVQA